MRIPNIYTPNPLNVGQTDQLDEKSAQHVGKVLRAKPGYRLNLFNGDGMHYPSEVIQVTKKGVEFKVLESLPVNTESNIHTHVGQVMSRGERMDYMIQKSTELGVNEITPLTSERCELKLQGDRIEKKRSHWQQVAISAAEQCGRARVPEVHSPISLAEWVASGAEREIKLVLHHSQDQDLQHINPAPTSVRLLVGPEGGLSEQEVATSQSQGFITTTLGPRIFRTETAPVAALAVIQWLWGDF